jgi:hypothetical protein
MIRVPTRFASLRPAPGSGGPGAQDSAGRPGAVAGGPGGIAGLASPAAFAAACAVLGLAAGSVRVLIGGGVSVGGEVAGVALLIAASFCYLKVVWGGLHGVTYRTQLANLVTLLALVSCAPIPLGRAFLPLEVVLPAAALVAVSWPAGLWLGAGSLAVPAITAIVFGYPASAIFRQAAQAAALGVAVAGLVKLAARAKELRGVQSDLAELSQAHEGTTQRLRQADELLEALGWRLSVIARMSGLASRVADQRPGLAGRELDHVRERACEWPGSSEPPAEAGGATALNAEIHAAGNVLAAAGIECTTGTVPAGLAGDSGDALAFFVHESAAHILGQPDIRSCAIRVCDDGARIRLDLEWDSVTGPSATGEAALERLAARMAAVDGQCEVMAKDGRSVWRANIPKPAERH